MQGTLEKFPEEFKITKMETNKLVKGKAVSAKPWVQNTFHIYTYWSVKIAETSRKPRNSAHIRHGNVTDITITGFTSFVRHGKNQEIQPIFVTETSRICHGYTHHGFYQIWPSRVLASPHTNHNRNHLPLFSAYWGRTHLLLPRTLRQPKTIPHRFPRWCNKYLFIFSDSCY